MKLMTKMELTRTLSLVFPDIVVRLALTKRKRVLEPQKIVPKMVA